MAPDTICTRLCAVLTWKMPSNIGIPFASLVTPGTKPRIPTAKKTIPKSIPSVLTIAKPPVGLRRYAYGSSHRWLAREKAGLIATGHGRMLSKIDNMKLVYLLVGACLAIVVDLSPAEDS